MPHVMRSKRLSTTAGNTVPSRNEHHRRNTTWSGGGQRWSMKSDQPRWGTIFCLEKLGLNPIVLYMCFQSTVDFVFCKRQHFMLLLCPTIDSMTWTHKSTTSERSLLWVHPETSLEMSRLIDSEQIHRFVQVCELSRGFDNYASSPPTCTLKKKVIPPFHYYSSIPLSYFIIECA